MGVGVGVRAHLYVHSLCLNASAASACVCVLFLYGIVERSAELLNSCAFSPPRQRCAGVPEAEPAQAPLHPELLLVTRTRRAVQNGGGMVAPHSCAPSPAYFSLSADNQRHSFELHACLEVACP